jgi:metal-responsive CopG/Arc/MetJ family transcriptional regulator
MGLISKTKEMITFSIDTNLKAEFMELSKKKNINRSGLVSSLIQKWVEENK